MKQMISVYRRKDAFLMHPNSQIGDRGVWLAQEPGLGLSFGASDAVSGERIADSLFIRHITSALGPDCVKTPNLEIFAGRITIPTTEKTA